MTDYRKYLLDQAREARRGGSAADKAPAANRKDERRAAAEARAQTAPLRKKVQEAEKKLEKLGKDKAAIEAKLADPKLYSGPGEAVAKLQMELAEIDRAIADTESVWLELNEQLEAAS